MRHSDARITQQSTGLGQVVIFQHGGTTADTGRIEPGSSTFTNHRALEFGKRAEDMEDQLAAGCTVIDRLGDRMQAYVTQSELLDRLDQLLE